MVAYIEAHEDWAALRADAGGTAALLAAVSRRALARLHPTHAPRERSRAQPVALQVLGSEALARRIVSLLDGDEGALCGAAMVAHFCGGSGGLPAFTYRRTRCSPYAFIALAGRLPDLKLTINTHADWAALEASETRWLERLPQLRALEISLKENWLQKASEAPLAALSALTELSELRLTYPRLTMAPLLASLPPSIASLQLDGSGVAFADGELAGFTRLSRLQRLSIRGCASCASGWPSLALNDLLPRLKSAARGSGAAALPALVSLRAGFRWCAALDDAPSRRRPCSPR